MRVRVRVRVRGRVRVRVWVRADPSLLLGGGALSVDAQPPLEAARPP